MNKQMVIGVAIVLVVILYFVFAGGPSKPLLFEVIQPNNGDILDREDNTVEYSSTTAKRFTLLYFSAGWCPPCHQFTPVLAEIYKQTAEQKSYEILFVSFDRSEDEMNKYREDLQMPWKTLKFNSLLKENLKKHYAANAIPCLVLFDKRGKILADSFDGSKYLGPIHVLNKLNELTK